MVWEHPAALRKLLQFERNCFIFSNFLVFWRQSTETSKSARNQAKLLLESMDFLVTISLQNESLALRKKKLSWTMLGLFFLVIKTTSFDWASGGGQSSINLRNKQHNSGYTVLLFLCKRIRTSINLRNTKHSHFSLSHGLFFSMQQGPMDVVR